MMKKYIALTVVCAAAILAAGLLGYLLHSKSGEVTHLSARIQSLEHEKDLLKAEATTQNDSITGLQNLFPVYIMETESILTELSTAIPVSAYTTHDEQQMMEVIKNWIVQHRVADKDGLSLLEGNRVVLSLKPLGPASDGSYGIQALYYELPDTALTTNGLPRPPGKDYLGVSQFIMQQQKGSWLVLKYVDKF